MLSILILVTLASTMLLISLLSKFKRRKEYLPPLKTEARFRKYLIPKSFWDDVNKIDLAIYQMGYDELDHVVFLIDQFCDKYGEISDHNTYRQRVATMLTNYQTRKKWILSKHSFNHQNQYKC